MHRSPCLLTLAACAALAASAASAAAASDPSCPPAKAKAHQCGAPKPPATPPRRSNTPLPPAVKKLTLVYTHIDHADYSEDNSDPLGASHDTYHQRFVVTARIPLKLKGAVATGSGPISYTKAEYTVDENGHSSGQSYQQCGYVSHTTLVATKPSTASATLSRSTKGVWMLNFNPGRPQETTHYVDTNLSGPCPGHESTQDEQNWIGTFTHEYQTAYPSYDPKTGAAWIYAFRPGKGRDLLVSRVGGGFPGRPGDSTDDYLDTYSIERR